jgi:hypothetical protein
MRSGCMSPSCSYYLRAQPAFFVFFGGRLSNGQCHSNSQIRLLFKFVDGETVCEVEMLPA